MSDQIRESKHERKVSFHAEAPFAKHDYRYRSRDVIRLAGQVWAESSDERQNRLRKERLFKSMRSIPVGLGFANKDTFGPDNNYNTVDYIKRTPDPGY